MPADAAHAPIVPLSRLLREGRARDCVVAFETVRGGARAERSVDLHFTQLDAESAALAAALRSAGPGRFVLFAQDAFAFAVGLVGLWRAGCVAVLPPNGEEGTLSRLRAEVLGVVSDRADLVDAGTAVHPRRALVSVGAAEPGVRAGSALDANAPALELYTSGTAGASKPVVKALHQLEAEIAALEHTLGGQLADAQVFATAAPQHLYGLLFRVLWPLCAGRPFASETLLHAEELVPRLVASAASVLVGTPAHLRRLREHPALPTLRGRLRAVFSSGGPLDAETAASFAAALGAPPLEIYGATETGGVALRQQDAADTPWTPFPEVRVERDAESGCARVRSPYLAHGDEEHGVVIGDRVTLLGDGRFRLEGRADRAVKIGDKRLSLPDMEERLLAHADVADAALLVLERGSLPRVAAVVVPSASGRAAQGALGRRGFVRTLSLHLARDFDRVLLPRAWRVVDEVPLDDRGKRSQERLAPLFAVGSSRPVDPELLDERREPSRIERWLRVPDELAYFDGHFPGSPVVPGVAQLRWALAAAEVLLGGPVAIERIDAIKWKEMLRAGDEFHLALEIAPADDGRSHFSFEVTRDGRAVSSGRGVLGPPVAGASAA